MRGCVESTVVGTTGGDPKAQECVSLGRGGGGGARWEGVCGSGREEGEGVGPGLPTPKSPRPSF